jgi:hypothetical protein
LARIGDQDFVILYKDVVRDEEKSYRYRTEDPNKCSEILAKLKFLVGGTIVKKTT